MNFLEILPTTQKPYGFGLFVRKDERGLPCRIGDRVRVKRESVVFQVSLNEDDDIEVPEKEWEGVLILRKSVGVLLKTDDKKCIKPKFGHSKIPWHWTLLQSNSR